MKKNDVLLGAGIVLIVGFWILDVSVDVLRSYYESFQDYPLNYWFLQIIIGIGMIGTLVMTIFAIMDLTQEKPSLFKLDSMKITITVPGYFILPIILTSLGGLMMLSGNYLVGLWYSILGLPTLLVFSLIALRRIKKSESVD